MCGLIGCVGSIKQEHEKAVEALLIVDSLRGQHSTGVAAINSVGATKVAKAVGHAYDLFDSRQYNGIFNGAMRAIIGHNRYATTGAVSKKNAHPFEFDTLIGAHNGTLRAKYRLDNHNKFDVDSEAFYHHIEKYGVKDALNTTDGAWALTWWDKVHKTMNLLRNKERPLFTAYTKDHSVMFWASEYWMLSGVVPRYNIELDKIEILPEDQHISIAVDLLQGTLDKPKMVYSPCTYTKPTYFPPAQPPASKVVEVKKNESTGGTTSYKGSTEKITGICGATKKDRHEVSYITVHQDEFPLRDVRWYYDHTINPIDWIGEEIECELYTFRIAAQDGVWHRVNPNSVTLLDNDPVVDTNPKMLHTCMWCAAPIFEGDAYAVVKEQFTTGDDKLCKDCMSDSEITEYVTVVTHVS